MRVAIASDIEPIVSTAFFNDPPWGPAFPDERLRAEQASNPVNNARYEGVGFVARDRITTATGHVVTTMWRPAR